MISSGNVISDSRNMLGIDYRNGLSGHIGPHPDEFLPMKPMRSPAELLRREAANANTWLKETAERIAKMKRDAEALEYSISTAMAEVAQRAAEYEAAADKIEGK